MTYGFYPSPVGFYPPPGAFGVPTYPLVWPGMYPFAFPFVKGI